MKKESDLRNYKTVYEDFWKDIVEKGGELDKDAVMRELSDYEFLMGEVPKVYMAVSGHNISKTNTYAFEVISEFEGRFEDKEITKSDVTDMIGRVKNLEELVDELESYFEIN